MDIYSILRMLSAPIGVAIIMLILMVKNDKRGFSYIDILPLFLSLTIIITSSIFIMNSIKF